MRVLFSKHMPLFVVGAIVVAVLLFVVGKSLFGSNGPEKETAVVGRGDVEVLVSVSGAVRTPNTATLGFPQAGVVREVLVREGDEVQKGQILASLSQSVLIAEYNDALAYLGIQEAYRDELVAGPREESRAVTRTDVEIADAELERVEKEQEELVASALRTLYSSDLEAVSVTETNADVPPTITGTFTCDMPTTYHFEVYPSNAKSGYSYRITEGGSGVAPAVTESATPFSDCGLYIQFDADEAYGTREWIVEVPNPRGAGYVTNLNAYNLALKERANAIEAAAQNRTRAIEEGVLDVATPRTEELARAEANVAQARARLAAVEARIADITIRAPFDGIVTAVDITVGEVGQQSTGITMTADDAYELKIRVPEIDITHIEAEDTAVAIFDARPDMRVPMVVSFVSPLPTEIDGVSYYDTFLSFSEMPEWMRTGLNADVDIAIDAARNVLKLPKRFIIEESGATSVLVGDNNRSTRQEITVGLTGNDGYVEVSGINEGVQVVAP